MKKMLIILGLGLFISAAASAQTTDPKVKVESTDGKLKAKPKTTAKQKVHNVIHPKRKESSGLKVKGKTDK